MKKEKILFMISRFPYPTIDGTRYKILYNVAEAVQKEFDIEFFVCALRTPQAEDVAFIEENFGKVHFFKITPLQFLWNVIKAFSKGLPFQAEAFIHPKAVQWVTDHMSDYVSAYVHTIRMTQFFDKLPSEARNKVIVDLNDAISLSHGEMGQKLRFPFSIAYRWEASLVKKYEVQVLQKFQNFNVITAYDKAYLVANAGKEPLNFFTIPHGLRLPTQLPQEGNRRKIYFIGQLGYAPNKDAVAFFVDHILGPLQKRVPDIELCIIGKEARGYEGYKKIPRVIFLGFVEDLESVLQECACLVAPVRFGAGMPSKVVEALAYGMPVVTTPIGVRGIPSFQNGKELLVVEPENIECWVNMIAELLHNSQHRAEIGKNARAYAEKHFALESVQRQWVDLFHLVVHKKAP